MIENKGKSSQNYSRVARVFEGFDYVGPIGGKMRRHRVGRTRMGTSFTERQRDHVVETIAGLNMLANGQIAGERKSSRTQDFAQRIEHHIRDGVAESLGIGDAFYRATRDLLSDFAQRNSALLPALDAMSSKAGIEGLDLVYWQSFLIMEHAVTGRLNRKNATKYHTDLMQQSEFTGDHSSVSGEAYQIVCLGKAFAKTLTRHTIKAALNLAEDTILNIPAYGRRPVVNFADGVREHINTIGLQARGRLS